VNLGMSRTLDSNLLLPAYYVSIRTPGSGGGRVPHPQNGTAGTGCSVGLTGKAAPYAGHRALHRCKQQATRVTSCRRSSSDISAADRLCSA
jgi:hypothetical protein